MPSSANSGDGVSRADKKIAASLAHHSDMTTTPGMARERYCHTPLRENMALDSNSSVDGWGLWGR